MHHTHITDCRVVDVRFPSCHIKTQQPRHSRLALQMSVHLLQSFFVYNRTLLFYGSSVCSVIYKQMFVAAPTFSFPYPCFIPYTTAAARNVPQKSTYLEVVYRLILDYCKYYKSLKYFKVHFRSLNMLGIIVISSMNVQIFQNIISHEVHLLAGMMLSAAWRGNSVRDIKQESREQSAYSDSVWLWAVFVPKEQIHLCLLYSRNHSQADLHYTSGCFYTKVLI